MPTFSLSSLAVPLAGPPPANFSARLATTIAAAKAAQARAASGDKAIAHSVVVYHADAAKAARMESLLQRFVRAGDLAFDVGAHVGDRVAALRTLGACVVALEPQPAPLAVLRDLFGDDPGVSLVPALCGHDSDAVTFHVNNANPTVSTASAEFLVAADGAGGWEGQVWDQTVTVPSVSLDALRVRFGEPRFIKIDVEGYEAQVLAGLTVLPPVLSFEFTTIQRDVARACLDRLDALGGSFFNYALGESHELALPQWVSAHDMARFLDDLPHAANSGDVYCVSRDVAEG